MGCDGVGGGGVGCWPRFQTNNVSARLSENVNPLHYTKLAAIAKGGAIVKHHAPPHHKERLYKETRNLLLTLVPQGLDPIPQLPAVVRAPQLHPSRLGGGRGSIWPEAAWFNLAALA